MLRIEEELGAGAKFAGASGLRCPPMVAPA
jgi:hypothetical protein